MLDAAHSGNRVLGEVYFVTTTVVDWIDVFTRPRYKHIILDSLAYCQKAKGLKIYAWVLMTNHLHAIVSAGAKPTVAEIMRDFKKFTSQRILAELPDDLKESRRQWMLKAPFMLFLSFRNQLYAIYEQPLEQKSFLSALCQNSLRVFLTIMSRKPLHVNSFCRSTNILRVG